MRQLTPLLSFAIVSFSMAARAEDPAAAQAHVDEGTKLFNVQQYDKAADAYQAAYLLDPKPAYLYAVAQAQRLSGDCTKAVQTYRAYLRTEPSADERARAEKNIERCEQQVQAVQATVQTRPAEVQVPLPPPKAKDLAPDVETPTSLAMPQKAAAEPPTSTRSYVIGHILVGAGVVAIAGGAYAYRKGHDAIDAHNSSLTYDAFLKSRAGLEDGRREQMLGVTALAAGGGLAIAGVIYYIVHARSPVDVSAQVKPGSTVVSIRRSF